MKWILLVLGAIVLVAIVVAIIGALLPRSHVLTRSGRYPKSPKQIYAIARDVAAAPTWRQGLKSVELLEPRNGKVCFREVSSHGAITYLIVEDQPGVKLVTEIADPNLPFGGTWTFEFSGSESDCTLSITEHGEVKNVVFRFMARFIFGYAGTIETYLQDLERRMKKDEG